MKTCILIQTGDKYTQEKNIILSLRRIYIVMTDYLKKL